ncbi:Heat shock factor protein [Choanephora cucurbitarum]|uniref:Heat shock factor protein n=1 Tax=Choanephora cucurbitarum TaxID=101091 RepID=A0A1C7N1P7_9FUNG|nr:Heat shock factor protein [Choanephora cucurbitarum]
MAEQESQYHYTTQESGTPPTNHDGAVRTQAAFVNKLYKMLEDNSIHDLISWSERGDLFSVSNPTSFSRFVLPQYFKHNNWQSFVRQLNMYGFHKVNDMIHSNLTSDNQTWEFKHPHFKRGEIEDLQHIKRKSAKPSTTSLPPRIPNYVRQQDDNDDDLYGPMYKHVLHIEERLQYVTKSHEVLKKETHSLRGLIKHQQDTISEFASILTDILVDEANIRIHPNKRDSILNRLNELQMAYVNDNGSQTSSTASVPSPRQQRSSMSEPYPTQPTKYYTNTEKTATSAPSLQLQHPTRHSHSPSQTTSSPSRSDPFIHSSFPPSSTVRYSAQPSSASPPSNIVSKNKRLGFGKESHLLNPEPHLSTRPSPTDSNETIMKKQRIE